MVYLIKGTGQMKTAKMPKTNYNNINYICKKNTKQRLKCLARGHNAVSLVMLESRSPVKHSTTGLLFIFINNDMYTIMMHLSDHIRLIKLHKQNRYNLCGSHLQVKIRSNIYQKQ